ncbi:hypothetical protein C8J27_106178 [Rhodobacter aestuarii]|uniref:Uncharacterized protein n=1 Tax=Rhodobacter aestuarii TaxID=453582 RepID=A0A1N7M7Z4_9RHOB|nr:helix-turn-helix domain-containing protein [Rhodobacter aestuarii]PTV94909.1 hypothetical protein C8J27_106178 [Rhodobacter aestuarii]SIS82235.1 hypothetical protein SAMN05421580_105178 [Rhodobacter aestuarii]
MSADPGLRAVIQSFLAMCGPVSAEDVALWEAALAACDCTAGEAVKAFGGYLAMTGARPAPITIVTFIHAERGAGSMRAIALRVATRRGLTLEALWGTCRDAALVDARAEVAGRMRAAGYDVARIARFLRRDRSTVSHLLQRGAQDLTGPSADREVVRCG